MRILVVEDDRRLADVMRDGLEEIGMSVDIVTDGDAVGRAVDTSGPYDVIVLDVMLGMGPDGFEVCSRLRNRGISSAVLMLTALDAVPDRVRGLDAGADDYLAKPFAFSELVARIKAVTRRHAGLGREVREFHGIRLDPRSRRVTVGGSEVELTRKEFDILELLMNHEDHVLSKERILAHVWGDDASPGSNLVEVHVARLRRKLADTPDGDCISTVRNVGYRFGRGAARVA